MSRRRPQNKRAGARQFRSQVGKAKSVNFAKPGRGGFRM